MKKKRLLITVALITCFMVCLAAATSITGKWTGSIQLPDGNTYSITYVLTAKDSLLTGTAQANGDPKSIQNGKVNGADFSFSVMDDNDNPIQHSGKYYADGDSVSLNVIFQGNKLHSTLKRAGQ